MHMSPHVGFYVLSLFGLVATWYISVTWHAQYWTTRAFSPAPDNGKCLHTVSPYFLDLKYGKRDFSSKARRKVTN